MIRCRGLVHVYPNGTRALQALDLEIRAGERVAIVGQNGSGKSTLVRHWNGLLRPTGGEVEIEGRSTAGQKVAALARTVGIAFQDPDRQIFAGRVRTEVEFGPRNVGLRGAALTAAVDGALEATGLTDAANANPYDLGFSRRKLLALASILAMGTPVVVLDEPTTGQDARGTRRVETVVADLASQGRTVVAISHDMRFVAETFARIVVMAAGRVILDGPPEEVFAAPAWPALESTYLEAPLSARLGARLGLGSTPTDAALLEAMAGRP
ncbi:MAG: energy-coupling factor ABC transporter ATP-binding protein [Chloroflexi bacterium]|nr:energy-coupling factor ABC transporter ATP-binding protein [Chloroflexota bacterium]